MGKVKKHKLKKHKTKGYEEEYEEDRENKSLKIVLKVGGSDPTESAYSPAGDEKRHKHKKKKKKKSADKDKDRDKHDNADPGLDDKEDGDNEEEEEEEYSAISQEEDVMSQEEDEESFEPPAKKRLLDVDEESNSSLEPMPRRTRYQGEVKDDAKAILNETLQYIQKNIQRRDVHEFFAYPVNDTIAPGYSTIIKEPMDFSTMLNKIETDKYDSVMDYKADFVVMCNNAMTYNRPETIYYKEAKKLLQYGMKVLSKEKLLAMKKSLGFMASITMEELGIFKQDNTGAVIEAITAKEKEYEKTVKIRDNVGRFEAFPDKMTPEEILAQAQAAAKEAAEMLTMRKPKTKLSFLRRRDDGTTSLTVLNTDNDGIVGDNEKIISLGSLTGKLTSGTGSLAGFKEDKRNRAAQINYLNYGPFSSHAPVYDTSFSNASKEESDLLLSTYGDESGLQYAKSVMKFVEEAEEDCTRIVDSLLDVLTKGQHTITMKQIEQKRKEDHMQKAEWQRRMAQFKASEGLADAGTGDEVEESDLQQQLDKTANLLKDLEQTQHERLSLKPTPHLGSLPGPNEKEFELAGKVTSELTKMTKDNLPRNVVSVPGVRKAMGITTETIEMNDEFHPIEIDEQLDNQPETFVDTQTDQLANFVQADLGQTISQPISQYVSQPVSHQTVSQPLVQHTNQPVSQPVSQPVNQPVSQPFGQAVGHSFNQSLEQSVGQPFTQAVNQTVGQSFSQSLGQPVSQPLGQPSQNYIDNELLMATDDTVIDNL